MPQLSRLHFGCWACTHRHTHSSRWLWFSVFLTWPLMSSSHLLSLSLPLSLSLSLSLSPEHFQVQIREWHPPCRAPQAGAVRWQAGQLHLLHLQRQGDGCPALPGVVAQGKPLHLCPLATRTYAAGQCGASSLPDLWITATSPDLFHQLMYEWLKRNERAAQSQNQASSSPAVSVAFGEKRTSCMVWGLPQDKDTLS